ncbi:MAG: PIN domain protein [Candidatus Bathyarchaeota archaeon BA2]|nr:MAG: PIN domain protein [Candidatus Bathyarchaeota archaeon BA2]
MKEVLDSRFLIEHYYSTNTETKQKTSKKLKELIQRKEGLLPTIVISETIKIICEKVGREEAEICYLSIIVSGLQIQELNSKIARQAGLLKCQYKSIPMGDCIIASTAIINQAKILSDDSHFDNIKETKRSWI